MIDLLALVGSASLLFIFMFIFVVLPEKRVCQGLNQVDKCLLSWQPVVEEERKDSQE